MRWELLLIVPTLRRPEFLERCLGSIALQSSPPGEVLVGIRADDALSPPVLTKFVDCLRVKAVEAKGVG